jgi:phenylpyruvate tautomerase PptA (4-oxalocrotonate tautomerase family)
MPHLRVRAVTENQIQKISESLIAELAQTLKSPEDNFTLELISSRFYEKSKPIDSYPFVEVLWFARPKEMQDLAAKLITDKIKSITQAQDVIVVFQVLEKASYYENGEHF